MSQRQFRNDDTDTWGDRYGDGSDGSLTISSNTTDSTANTTLTGTGGGISATAGSGSGFASGNLVLIHQTQGTGNGAWELNKISSIGSGTNWTMAYNLINTYNTGAQVYLLKKYSSVTINTGVTLTSSSWGGSTGGILALLCDGILTVTGGISGQSIGFRGGTSFVAGAGATANQGESSTGAGSQANGANGMGGGGGEHDSGNRGAGGGGGGYVSSGTAGTTNASSGSVLGGAGGNADAGSASDISLQIAFFGGAGGSGSANSGSSTSTGGHSGGFVLLIAKTITITGSINAGGENGVNSPSGAVASSGGGAGGAVLLKGQILTLGTTLITSLGGSGGTGGDPNFAPNGGGGSKGRIHADYSSSLSGTTDPTLDSDGTQSVLADLAVAKDVGYSYLM